MDQVKKYFSSYIKEANLNSIKIKTKSKMVADVSVAGGTIYLNEKIAVSRSQLKALIAHEIGTHIMTFKNGVLQPFSIFNKGLAGYLSTQEGLAIYNSQQVDYSQRRLSVLAKNVLLISKLDKYSFRDIFDDILDYGYQKKTAWKMAVKLKRGLTNTAQGGGFTKGYLYLKGLRQIENFISKGGDHKDLYYGKINIKDLDKVKAIKGIRAPKYVFNAKILEKIMNS